MKKTLILLLTLLIITYTFGCNLAGKPSPQVVVKDDAYYESLIKGVREEYTFLTLEEKFEHLSCFFDLNIFYPDGLDDTSKADPEEVFCIATAAVTSEEWDELYKSINEKDEYLYRTEVIEKYAYYYFNYKIDCTILEGYSEEEGGVRRVCYGFGGGRFPKTNKIEEIGNGKYLYAMDFYDYDKIGEDKENSKNWNEDAIMGYREFIYQVNGERVYLVGIGKYIDME